MSLKSFDDTNPLKRKVNNLAMANSSKFVKLGPNSTKKVNLRNPNTGLFTPRTLYIYFAHILKLVPVIIDADIFRVNAAKARQNLPLTCQWYINWEIRQIEVDEFNLNTEAHTEINSNPVYWKDVLLSTWIHQSSDEFPGITSLMRSYEFVEMAVIKSNTNSEYIGQRCDIEVLFRLFTNYPWCVFNIYPNRSHTRAPRATGYHKIIEMYKKLIVHCLMHFLTKDEFYDWFLKLALYDTWCGDAFSCYLPDRNRNNLNFSNSDYLSNENILSFFEKLCSKSILALNLVEPHHPQFDPSGVHAIIAKAFLKSQWALTIPDHIMVLSLIKDSDAFNFKLNPILWFLPSPPSVRLSFQNIQQLISRYDHIDPVRARFDMNRAETNELYAKSNEKMVSTASAALREAIQVSQQMRQCDLLYRWDSIFYWGFPTTLQETHGLYLNVSNIPPTVENSRHLWFYDLFRNRQKHSNIIELLELFDIEPFYDSLCEDKIKPSEFMFHDFAMYMPVAFKTDNFSREDKERIGSIFWKKFVVSQLKYSPKLTDIKYRFI